jgi:hypothetical protein
MLIMKNKSCLKDLLPVIFMSLSLTGYAAPIETLISGDVCLNVEASSSGGYVLTVNAYGHDFNSNTNYNPAVFVDATIKSFYPNYTSYTKQDNKLYLTSVFTASPSTTKFEVSDVYTSCGEGEYSLSRSVKVLELGSNPYTDGFYTSFGLQFNPENSLDEYDVFIPGVWYKANFEEAGNLPSSLPQASDNEFCYRDDRTPLPVVMMRNKADGVTISIIEKGSRCETVLSDSKGVVTNEKYQFGGVGLIKRSRTKGFSAVVTYPGSDQRTGGLGVRRHPIVEGYDNHKYEAYFKISKTSNYAEGVSTAWNKAFELYSPTIYQEDLKSAWNALIATCEKYYLAPNRPDPYRANASGFPWSVYLTDFSMNKNTYEIGFVGAQPVAGYALFRAGVEDGNSTYQRYGNAVLNFWALNSLSDLGFPKSRYAALNGTWDSWAYTAIRQACWGMQGLLNAWCFAKKNDINRPAWLSAATKFGDWLVENQNEDGSYYKEYMPFEVVDGKHPAGNQNKFTTTCVMRFLIELYIVTNDERYKDCLMKAADFCYEQVHKDYHYIACVIDNPQTIDSESGQQALNAFLSMYDFTGDKKWLEAAEQAAIYLETWTHMMEVPVELDQEEETDWPKDRSIVGQHLIAIGHSACDLGFAWSSFALYRLYLLTGNDHYLQTARVSAHNTKQSMNLGQKLYPGEAEGLQQEAFQVKTSSGNPRRQNSVMEALTWNFAAHLDPMIRFKDAFGTVDLEEVEKMPKEQVYEMQARYAKVQSSDYGQEVTAITTVSPDKDSIVWSDGNRLYFRQSKEDNIMHINLYDVTGSCIFSDNVVYDGNIGSISISQIANGIKLVELKHASGFSDMQKLLYAQ